ncbi:hypothetical protein ABZW30_10705 [Kitasatospora sp. NPDC004669]|uniref:hypothetical protein n=1 Tax=Kitasatospora sp. NPDC004669 TaxID=3154555 RepID=UPI0033A30F04
MPGFQFIRPGGLGRPECHGTGRHRATGLAQYPAGTGRRVFAIGFAHEHGATVIGQWVTIGTYYGADSKCT